MQPNNPVPSQQEQSPIQPTPQITPQPVAPLPPSKPRGKLYVIIAVIATFIIGAAAIAIVLNGSQQKQGSQDKQQSAQVPMFGDKPYANACSVATEEDFRRIFALDNNAVGTITETGILPPKAMPEGIDISSFASAFGNKSDRNATCHMALGKNGAGKIWTIELKLNQLTSNEDAKEAFELSKERVALLRDSNEKDIQLPSFKADAAQAQATDSEISAIVLHNSYVAEISYDFVQGETAEAITPKLDQFVQAVIKNLDDRQKLSTQINLSGRTAQYGKKFADVCHSLGVKAIAAALNNIEYKVEDAYCYNAFGSLPGSRAYDDGMVSRLDIDFNSAKDREAIAANNQLTRSEQFPHKATFKTTTLESNKTARALLADKKATRTKPGATITPTSGLGDEGFKVVKPSTTKLSYKGQPVDIQYMLTTYFIVKDAHVIEIEFDQTTGNRGYQTTPTELTDQNIANVYKEFEKLLNQ